MSYIRSEQDFKTEENPIYKAKGLLKKTIDFQTKLILANAKNLALPGDEGGSSKKEMGDSMNSLAQMMGMEASMDAQAALIEAMKNPAVDLMSLKDKLVEFKDDKKSFSGEEVTYNYKVSHNEESSSAVVNLTFTVRDAKGTAVRTVHQTGKIGDDQSFVWNGKNDNGETAEFGIYSLDLSAEGVRNVGGMRIMFPVKAGAVLSGVVESVKFNNGVATAIIIDGKVVTREQICDVRDVTRAEETNYLTPDLIGRNVKMDFSRVEVKEGALEIYFNNHVKKSGDLTFKIFDKDDKFIKTLKSSEKIGVGVGKLVINNHEIQDGNYNVRTFVADLSDPDNPVDTELKYNINIFVTGISRRDGTVISFNDETYSPNNIDSVTGNFISPLDQRRREYIGTSVTYRDDLFEYTAGADPKTFVFDKPKEDGIISYGQMTIYDPSTSELVAVIKSQYKPYNELDDDSKNVVDGFITSRGHVSYDALPPAAMLSINRDIEKGLIDGSFVLREEYREYYNNYKALLTFSAWDGTLDDGSMAVLGKEYRREFTPIYAGNDNTSFFGQTNYETSSATVQSIDEIGGELTLNLSSGRSIPEGSALNVS